MCTQKAVSLKHPSSKAKTHYARGLCWYSNGSKFKTTQTTRGGVSFIATHNAYTSTNKNLSFLYQDKS